MGGLPFLRSCYLRIVRPCQTVLAQHTFDKEHGYRPFIHNLHSYRKVSYIGLMQKERPAASRGAWNSFSVRLLWSRVREQDLAHVLSNRVACLRRVGSDVGGGKNVRVPYKL